MNVCAIYLLISGFLFGMSSGLTCYECDSDTDSSCTLDASSSTLARYERTCTSTSSFYNTAECYMKVEYTSSRRVHVTRGCSTSYCYSYSYTDEWRGCCSTSECNGYTTLDLYICEYCDGLKGGSDGCYDLGTDGDVEFCTGQCSAVYYKGSHREFGGDYSYVTRFCDTSCYEASAEVEGVSVQSTCCTGNFCNKAALKTPHPYLYLATMSLLGAIMCYGKALLLNL